MKRRKLVYLGHDSRGDCYGLKIRVSYRNCFGVLTSKWVLVQKIYYYSSQKDELNPKSFIEKQLTELIENYSLNRKFGLACRRFDKFKKTLK